MIQDITLKTKHLEFEKSSYLVDLKQTSAGSKYLEITQTLFQGNVVRKSSIKINPNNLNTLVATLLEFDSREEKAPTIPKAINRKDLEKLKSAYLKGSTLESLQLQFPQYTVEEMAAMLRKDGIAVVNQVYVPAKKRYFRRRR